MMGKPHIANILNLLCDMDFRKIMEEVDTRLYSEFVFRPKITSRRISALKRNLSDIIKILFSKIGAGLFDVDMGLRNMYDEKAGSFPYVELGGGSVGAGIMLEYLRKLGIIEGEGKYSLKKEYSTLLAS